MRQTLFYPLSLVYGAGLFMDRFLRTLGRKALPKPVISVGNLTWGGTGKTPLLIRLADDLKMMGFHPAILTRGYRGVGLASFADGDSDEVSLMKEKCPGVAIAVGADRIAGANRILLESQVDVFLLDDGFQHWPLARNLDIVCIDATDPWGGGWLVPAGRLREPASALARAQAVIVTRSELALPGALARIRGDIHTKAPNVSVLFCRFDAQLIEAGNGSKAPLGSLKGKKVLAVSALGNPGAFESNLKSLGAELLPQRFPDHHAYCEEDLIEIEKLARKQDAGIITTEKDWMKLKRMSWGRDVQNRKPIHLFAIKAEFSADDARLWNDLIRKVFP